MEINNLITKKELKRNIDELEDKFYEFESKFDRLCRLVGVAFSPSGHGAFFIKKDEKDKEA